MSRQRIRTSVLESSTEKCPHCGGTGHVRSVSSVALQLLRAIEETLLKGADAQSDRAHPARDRALCAQSQARASARAGGALPASRITVNADERSRPDRLHHRPRRAGDVDRAGQGDRSRSRPRRAPALIEEEEPASRRTIEDEAEADGRREPSDRGRRGPARMCRDGESDEPSHGEGDASGERATAAAGGAGGVAAAAATAKAARQPHRSRDEKGASSRTTRRAARSQPATAAARPRSRARRQMATANRCRGRRTGALGEGHEGASGTRMAMTAAPTARTARRTPQPPRPRRHRGRRWSPQRQGTRAVTSARSQAPRLQSSPPRRTWRARARRRRAQAPRIEPVRAARRCRSRAAARAAAEPAPAAPPRRRSTVREPAPVFSASEPAGDADARRRSRPPALRRAARREPTTRASRAAPAGGRSGSWAATKAELDAKPLGRSRRARLRSTATPRPASRRDLALRVYTTRLLGGDPELVLHGGGNTSLKTQDARPRRRGGRGAVRQGLRLGHGGDRARRACRRCGSTPLRKLRARDDLSDEDMVRVQRANLIDPSAPNPSVELLLHAFLPHKFVDHTHATAVLEPDRSAGRREALRRGL